MSSGIRRSRRRHSTSSSTPPPAACRRTAAPARRRIFTRQPGLRHDVRQGPDALPAIRRSQRRRQLADGLGMLVEQAAESFFCGAACGRRPRPSSRLRQTAEEHLGRPCGLALARFGWIGLFAAASLWFCSTRCGYLPISGGGWTTTPPPAPSWSTRLARMQEKNPDAELRHKWVPYRPHLHPSQARPVAAEDAKFIDHEGFDWEGIQKALRKNLKKGKPRRRRLHHQPAAGQEPVSLLQSQGFIGARARKRMITLMMENI